ncbi:tRNA-dihydrouridine(47) synthase [NAD(P)(+)]-like [Kryptolebias marmoratus]|uniref:tRNA-dihydrouridine(47) synthase [NAD(P)(+)] n=1 Tax=Kryptolebias marmoratus TaxID=37003 RepID=A0A3Q3A8U1_KRYMA|nr:tRNA-dihydrouridine(47) synthase [NAD(P)(+)]-like [Kryptolebias marmoratus]XP_017275487.1 tRNA-dihydrouridine(47) synthase [NAD(P)(+)]-like [Kryptolebias marmoratus]
MEAAMAETTERGRDVAVKGEAAIKPEFLTKKEKFHGFIDSEWQDSEGEKTSDDNATPEETSVEEIQPKKLKLDPEEGKNAEKPDKKRFRGQNKSRPHTKPTTYEEKRLCLSVLQDRQCTFGDKCYFLHDVAEYMASKPADIGEHCYVYDTFGKCGYGPTCRFSKAHNTPDFKTMQKADLVKAYEGRVMVKNSLSKDLQFRLRKRSVAFKKSEEYLKMLSNKDKKKQHGNSDACAAEVSADLKEENKLISTETQLHTCPDKPPVKTVGPLTDADIIKLRPGEKKQVEFQDKLYLAPLTTCGNLPFRRICKRFGVDITCGEMAMCTNLLQGHQSEWALLKRHESEDLFGVQVEGCFPDTMTRCAELINNYTDVDFVDINSGCPIDLVYKKGGGCGLMTRTRKFEQIVKGMNYVLDVPLTVKIRTGVQEKTNIAHKLIPEMKDWGVSMITLHGRSREQRYTKLADWDYIDTCAKLASPVPLFGNGDILSYEDAIKARETGVSGIMIARGALIKPWIFTEIKESRHWDISSSERLDILKDFTNFGLEHWGSDAQGVEKTRTFMLEWLSFMCRYIPVGLLERVPQRINERPPYYMGRNYLETLMASQNVGDWIRISEMLLGPVPKNFNFLPKHKANAYK